MYVLLTETNIHVRIMRVHDIVTLGQHIFASAFGSRLVSLSEVLNV